MRMSALLGDRFKEKPAEASLISHIFLLRGGYIRQVGQGIYSLLPPAKRIAAKLESIIREEMDAAGGQEVLFPVVMPAELWNESGRYESIGSELMRMTDRGGHGLVLGMTHEEAAVALARGEARSYLKYPFMIYQIQTKFRDEPRPRGGLIRTREFTMKDAYSFHTSQGDLDSYYKVMHAAYERVFARVGLPDVLSIEGDSGMMGGKVSHEFMYINDCGEDSVVVCPSCGYKANMEVARSAVAETGRAEGELGRVHTPGVKTIESLCDFLGIAPEDTMKAVVYKRPGNSKPLVAFIRGDLQINESKLCKAIRAEVAPYDDYESASLAFGSIGAYGLKPEDADVLFDSSLEGGKWFACGGNEVDWHITGVSVPRDLPDAEFTDLAEVREGDGCPECGKPLSIKRGVEVGNIFQLGTKYTESMNMRYTDESGEQKIPLMGCYGIGVGRLLACICEARHDDYGPIWPKAVAPWQVHICVLKRGEPEVRETAERVYDELSGTFETLVDDRGLAPGVQFAEADLLGIPVRIVVSPKTLAEGKLELSTRDKRVSKKLVNVSDIASEVRQALALTD